MTFDDFLKTAWDDHGDKPQQAADRLATSLSLVTAPEHIAPFAQLVAHVFGEHLGQWDRGIEVLESLRGSPAFDDKGAVAGSVNRSIATLRYTGGDSAVLDPLSLEDRVAVLAAAASALAGRNEFKRAIAAYSEAMQCADAGLPSGSPAIRALAVGGNNLAAALEEKQDRDAAETQGMAAAAEGGLRYWKQAGTWLEHERAEYRLARSLLQAGQATAAIQSARRCVEVCEQNDAPAFEQFFGHAVLAVAQRAAGDAESFKASRKRALQLFEQVAPEERTWCEPELKEIGS